MFYVSIAITSCYLMCIVVLCVCITILDTVVAELLVKSHYPEGPATGHFGTDFLGFPVSVYKRMLRWFPTLQVVSACF